jgi:1-acyl-sn-glycerol-3-phosphate acyltransferase
VFYIRLILIFLWLSVLSILGTFYSILRWGNRNIDRDYARVFSWVTLKIIRVRLEVEGKEHLEAHQPCIFVVNHQSGLDMATMGAIYPKQTVVIGKKELAWIPFFGIFYVAAGNIRIDRQKTVRAIAGLNEVVKAIQERKVSIWIFPEGTRNRSGEGLLPFKRGAFHMALQAQVPIVPVVCSSLKPIVHWKERTLKKGIVRLRVLPPIDPKQMPEVSVEDLSEIVREKMLEALRGLETTALSD